MRDYLSYNDFLAFLSTKDFDLEKIADEVLKRAEYAGVSLTSREYYQEIIYEIVRWRQSFKDEFLKAQKSNNSDRRKLNAKNRKLG